MYDLNHTKYDRKNTLAVLKKHLKKHLNKAKMKINF